MKKTSATTETLEPTYPDKIKFTGSKAGNVRTHTPDEAYERVMSYAGASNYT